MNTHDINLPKFPTMLRKMWSGGEVQQWLDENIKPIFEAALQSQSMPPEISRDLLGKIVDEVFDGAIEDASVIEDIYRVVARECALQSQDRDDAERYRWLRDPCSGAEHIIFYSRGDYGKGLMSGEMLDAAIDAARRIEGDGE